jgi:hypothetical protein
MSLKRSRSACRGPLSHGGVPGCLLPASALVDSLSRMPGTTPPRRLVGWWAVSASRRVCFVARMSPKEALCPLRTLHCAAPPERVVARASCRRSRSSPSRGVPRRDGADQRGRRHRRLPGGVSRARARVNSHILVIKYGIDFRDYREIQERSSPSTASSGDEPLYLPRDDRHPRQEDRRASSSRASSRSKIEPGQRPAPTPTGPVSRASSSSIAFPTTARSHPEDLDREHARRKARREDGRRHPAHQPAREPRPGRWSSTEHRPSSNISRSPAPTTAAFTNTTAAS